MTRETPLWLQAGEYPARLDRNFLGEVTRRQNRVFRGWFVSQRAMGPNYSVDITAGAGMVVGTSQAYQGSYFCQSTAVENVTAPPSPSSGTRTDTGVVTVLDPNAAGSLGDDWIFQIVQGTVIPPNSFGLFTVARSATEPSILNAALTDIAPRGEWTWTVSTVAPSGRGIPGDLWVMC